MHTEFVVETSMHDGDLFKPQRQFVSCYVRKMFAISSGYEARLTNLAYTGTFPIKTLRGDLDGAATKIGILVRWVRRI